MNIKLWASSLLWLFLLNLGQSGSAHAQSSRIAELRSCFTSEIALAIVDRTDPKKSYDENLEVGKLIGYVVAGYYKKSIWAMDDPETEGRDVIMYAMENAQNRVKYMKKQQIAQDVQDCRAAFKK